MTVLGQPTTPILVGQPNHDFISAKVNGSMLGGCPDKHVEIHRLRHVIGK